MGAHASKIKAIEVPLGSSGSDTRGYAYVTFRSSSSAKEAVRLLDQGTFKGRQVSVRLASDGVTLIDRPEEATGINMDREDNAKKTRRPKHRETIPTSSTSGKKSFPDKGSGSSKGDKSEKAEKDNRPTVPLVVDGRTKRART
jgi:RNA recognition motif-containing protein